MKPSDICTGENLKRLAVLLSIAVALYLVYTRVVENFEEAAQAAAMTDDDIKAIEDEPLLPGEEEPPAAAKPAAPQQEPAGYLGDSASLSLGNAEDAHIPLGKCGGSTQFMSSNLLPKADPQQEEFAEFAPSLDGKNFVDAYKYVFGAQSQSLRNANRQLRSDPVNPQDTVCPWMQSTIVPETRRPLEIGAGN